MTTAVDILLEVFTWIGLGGAFALAVVAVILWAADGTWLPEITPQLGVKVYETYFPARGNQEFALANLQLQMGRPRREVLHDLGVRTGVDDVRSLAAILIQADRFGASIANALRVQSDAMRTRRRQIAEEKAAKVAVKLIFPLVLFIFPAIFVVLVGPAALQIYKNLLSKTPGG